MMMVLQETANAAEHASGGMPQLDFATFPSQIFWLAVAFALLYLALDRFLIPRIGGAIEERNDRIADDLDLAARNKLEADEVLAAYEANIDKARARANTIAAQNRAELEARLAGESSLQETALVAQMAKAEAIINKARRDAMGHVEEIALDVAGDLASTLAGIALDARKLKKALHAASAGSR